MAKTEVPAKRPVCNVDGCGRPSGRGRAAMCEKHYRQMWRNGYLGPKRRDEVIPHSGGYVLRAAPGHPMSRGYRGYEHRQVFYDHHGEGPFRCRWCTKQVTWETMHVDHLDDDKTNNAIGNLAASCPTCNQKRGAWKVKRWARENRSVAVTWNGVTKPIGDWADDIGIDVRNMKRRLMLWPLDRAMTEPRGKSGPRSRRAE